MFFFIYFTLFCGWFHGVSVKDNNLPINFSIFDNKRCLERKIYKFKNEKKRMNIYIYVKIEKEEIKNSFVWCITVLGSSVIQWSCGG